MTRLGAGLRHLLDTDIAFPIRFERWLDSLGLASSTQAVWSVATLPCSLLWTDDHAFVRRTMTRREAQLREIVIPTVPSAPAYAQVHAMLASLRDELVAAECPPADLLDVHDFVRVTLSPAAQKQIAGG